MNPLRYCTSPTSLRAPASRPATIESFWVAMVMVSLRSAILRAETSIPGIRRPPAAPPLGFRAGERTQTTSARRAHACAAARGFRSDLLHRQRALRRCLSLGQWSSCGRGRAYNPRADICRLPRSQAHDRGDDNKIDADQRGHDQLEGHNGLPASSSRGAGSEFAGRTSATACAASRACSAFWAMRSR